MSGWAAGTMSGRVSETSFQTEDPAVQVLVRLGAGDGFTLRLSGGSLTDSFPFSHEDGTRLLDAIRSAGSSAHLLEECGHVLLTDLRFEIGVDGRPSRPTFHFTLRGERCLDMTFSLGLRAIVDFFHLVYDVLEEQTVRGVMES